MLEFKSMQDLELLHPQSLSGPIIREFMSNFTSDPDYQFSSDGWVCLIQPEDSYEVFFNDYTLIDVPWEGVNLYQGHYVCIYVPNNQFALVVIIQCDDWMDCELKEYLDDHLDPQPTQ